MKNSNSELQTDITDLCEKNFSHYELVELIKNGSLLEKGYAILNLDDILDENEAVTLVKNLTGVDGKIRFVCAYKLNYFIKIKPELFLKKENYENFAKGTIDIDGNVCRLVIDSVKNLKYDEEFSKFYANSLVDIIENALSEMSKFTFKDKKYKINKQTFKIYWCLKSLQNFYCKIKNDKIYELLKKCSNLQEYTIREKCAELIKIINSEDFSEIKNKLKRDENYYVRQVFTLL